MRRLPAEPVPFLAPASRRLAWAAIAIGGVSIAATRFGAVSPQAGIALVGLAILLAVMAIVAALVAFASIWRTGASGGGLAAKGLALAALLLAWPAYQGFTATQLPAVNDATTDVGDPPSFSRSRAALDARQGYLPPEFDRQRAPDQWEDYADLRTITIEQSPEDVMVLAQRAATNLGWQVVDTASPAGRTGVGRVDAVRRSLLFRFPDDITIRVRAGAGETRIDLRSASRIWRHDFGSNAQHIRDFTREIEALANAR